jgi:hypothetical protein
MNWNRLAIICALSLALYRPGVTQAGDPAAPEGRDLASEVRSVFESKCARCHGPNLARPRAGFGYVLDLRRLASSSDKIVPSKPEESELWTLIQNGEMPPPNSPTGPLTFAEKEVIREWIAAGAPVEGPSTAREATSLAPTDEAGPPASGSPVVRTVLWLGRFHLLLLHFPIALLMAAGAGEMWLAWKGVRTPSVAIRFCLVLGAIAAVPTVALGWLYALSGQGIGSGGLVALHGWIGTAAGASAVAAAVLSERDAGRGVRSAYVRVLIPVSVLLVAVAAHFGGLLLHGKHFFDW